MDQCLQQLSDRDRSHSHNFLVIPAAPRCVMLSHKCLMIVAFSHWNFRRSLFSIFVSSLFFLLPLCFFCLVLYCILDFFYFSAHFMLVIFFCMRVSHLWLPSSQIKKSIYAHFANLCGGSVSVRICMWPGAAEVRQEHCVWC